MPGLSKNRVLVVGGAGFVGSAVVSKLLSSGFEVTVFDNLASGSVQYVNPAAILIRGDILSLRALRRASRGHGHVIHLAARPFIPESFVRAGPVRHVNVDGTANVLQAVKEVGADIVYTSSAEVYGTTRMRTPMKEGRRLRPVSPYAFSKLEAERLVQVHLRHIPGVIFRLFNAFGPRETHPYVVPEFIRQALKSSTIQVGNLGTFRDFTYVEDTADGIVSPIRQDKFDRVPINLGSIVTREIGSVLKMIQRFTGSASKPVAVDPSRLRPADVDELVADRSRAMELLGWTPKWDFEQALKQTIEWYKENGMMWAYEATSRQRTAGRALPR